MTITVNFHEAETHLFRLLKRVQRGEQVIIAKAGKPIAILSPFQQAPAQRAPGIDSGKIEISPDFDGPLSELEP